MAGIGGGLRGRPGELGLTGRHVLLAMGGFLGVVLAVNTAMIYAALSTYSGVVAAEPYRKGLHYNERIVAQTRQRQLNWHEALLIKPDGAITLSIADADGALILGLDVDVSIGRPATNRDDVKLRLVAEAGGYGGKIAPLSPGAWIVAVEARPARVNSELIFRARQRLWLAP